MSAWEPSIGETSEWYTPAYVFEAMGPIMFDLDVAAPPQGGPHVPARNWICERSLDIPWRGFVWMNAPFGGRNGLAPWLNKFFAHGNGIALTPDRTSAPWWQDAARGADAMLMVSGKIKFERPDGSIGKSPGTGTTLFAAGQRAVDALYRAETAGLGTVVRRRA